MHQRGIRSVRATQNPRCGQACRARYRGLWQVYVQSHGWGFEIHSLPVCFLLNPFLFTEARSSISADHSRKVIWSIFVSHFAVDRQFTEVLSNEIKQEKENMYQCCPPKGFTVTKVEGTEIVLQRQYSDGV